MLQSLSFLFAVALSTAALFTPVTAQQAAVTKKLNDGFYLILADDMEMSKVQAKDDNQRVVLHDYKYLTKDPETKNRYLLLRTTPDVPLLLAKAPEKLKDKEGNVRLSLVLQPNLAKKLETFTKKHKGDHVALVIGNEVITTHTIRDVISGGALTLSRCTDNGCEAVYRILKK